MLLPVEENCAEIVEGPNELELHRAFTRKMNHLLCVVSDGYHLSSRALHADTI